MNYICDNCWYDHRKRKVVSRAFHIIDVLSLMMGRPGKGRIHCFPRRSSGERILREFEGRLSTEHRLCICREIDNDIALRIFRFLGKHSYGGQREFTYDLKEFAVNIIGMTGTYQGCSHIARALHKAFRELEERGFLHPKAKVSVTARKGGTGSFISS